MSRETWAREAYLRDEISAEQLERELERAMSHPAPAPKPRPRMTMARVQARAAQVTIGVFVLGCIIFILGVPWMIVVAFLSDAGINGPMPDEGPIGIMVGMGVCALAVLPGMVWLFAAWREDDLL